MAAPGADDREPARAAGGFERTNAMSRNQQLHGQSPRAIAYPSGAWNANVIVVASSKRALPVRVWVLVWSPLGLAVRPLRPAARVDVPEQRRDAVALAWISTDRIREKLT